MKLLVFSDSHHSLRDMRRALDLEDPDCAIHLGDMEADAEQLRQEYPSLPIAGVPGNCDLMSASPLQKLLVYNGRRVLISHGHIWHVKSGYAAAIAEARRLSAHILLFGHTHRPFCERLEDGLWVMNPGSIRDGDYGVIVPDAAACYLRHV